MLSREYARQKYSEILGLPIEHAIVQNLEKHISNWAYLRSVDDKYYKCVQRYKHKFLSIYFNLKNSPNLKERYHMDILPAVVDSGYRTVLEKAFGKMWNCFG